jgi:hypothetical protein
MDFRTRVQIDKSDVEIDHTNKMMLFGSCFSENIGNKLKEHKFKVDSNPFGILYNPVSISNSLKRLLEETHFNESELVYNEMYHSFMHHGNFSDVNEQLCLNKINERYSSASNFLKETDILFITFGTSYAYFSHDTQQIVSNCHKFPANNFKHLSLSIDAIVEEWSCLIEVLVSKNSSIRFIFTVSPIRHFRDGAHDNQISKSILHIAIENIKNKFKDIVEYFPAYEIMIDELRDYRFYNEDMVHPTSVAQDYIWQCFSEVFFSEDTKKINTDWTTIRKSLDHRPLNTETQAYKKFLLNTLENIETFANKYPQIHCEKEFKQVVSLIEKVNNI